MDPNVRYRIEELEELVALIQNAAGAGVALAAIEKNRVQQVTAAGVAIGAGLALTLDAALTTVGPLGKIRISATYSGVGGGGAGGIHAFLQVKIGAGAFVTEYSWAPVATAGTVDGSAAVFEFDSGAPPGTVLTVHWQTTAGDDAVTLGGAAGNGAVLLVEELP